MSRNPKIEEILAFWHDCDHCDPSLKAANRKRRDDLIQRFIGDHPYTVDQVLNCLHSQYLDYRRERKISERLLGGQQAPQTPPPEQDN